MDQYETDFSGLEPEQTQPQQPDTPAAGKKASPFADSPYVAYEPPRVEPKVAPESQPWPPAKSKKTRSGGKTWLSVLAIVLSVCTLVGVVVSSLSARNRMAILQQQNTLLQKENDVLQQKFEDLHDFVNDNSYTGNGNSVSGTPSSPDGLTPGQVYAKNLDSVVLIYAASEKGSASGSGFILSQDGYVVTNYHVVNGATRFLVVTADGQQHNATLTGGDETNDVAVLKADATGLKPVTLGSSDDLIVGDQVVAIGNPLGDLTSTLTVGYISAKDRDVTTDGSVINMLQTDAAINSGNSGGPLFNMKGEVIGITTAKYSGASSSGASIEGIGFAIPMDDVAPLISELIEHGYVSHPYMGVYIREMTESIGVYVDSVEPGGPAFKAGLRQADIIVQLGEYEVTSISSLSKALNNFDVGDTTTVSVYRNRQVLELTITFTEKPRTSTEDAVPETTVPSDNIEDWFNDWFDRFFGNGN